MADLAIEETFVPERQVAEPPHGTSAVVLAAGLGARLGDGPKPLALVAGRTLLERSIHALRDAGAERIIVVIGHQKDVVRRFVEERRLGVELVENDDFHRGNASSFLIGGRAAGGRFLVTMVDHVLDPAAIGRVLASGAPFAIAVDSRPRFTDVAEATKVRLSDGRVSAVAHELGAYDAVDAGLFACDEEVVAAAERALASGETSWNAVKRRWLAEGGELACIDLEGAFWLDVDTKADARRAERLLVERAARKPLDGPVARTLNRPLSWRLSLVLVRAGVSSSLATGLAFLVALAAAAALAVGARASSGLLVGGISVQLASILDGVDGEIARATLSRSAAGAFVDSVLDRAADVAMLVGLAVAAGLSTPVWAALVASLVGSLLVPYVLSTYAASFGHPPPASFARLRFGRDVRLLVVAASALALRPAWGLFAVAALANLDVVARTATVWRRER